jgi:hypothetical protein
VFKSFIIFLKRLKKIKVTITFDLKASFPKFFWISASKNNKWDNKGVIDVKKQVLISYGVPKSDVELFEKILKENLSISVSKIINEQEKK